MVEREAGVSREAGSSELPDSRINDPPSPADAASVGGLGDRRWSGRGGLGEAFGDLADRLAQSLLIFD